VTTDKKTSEGADGERRYWIYEAVRLASNVDDREDLPANGFSILVASSYAGGVRGRENPVGIEQAESPNVRYARSGLCIAFCAGIGERAKWF
jgi:hypothetical protein